MLHKCLYCFYIQILIFIRKILCQFQAPDIPALPFTKGQSLDPTASNPIRQLFRHASEIVSRFPNIHNMKLWIKHSKNSENNHSFLVQELFSKNSSAEECFGFSTLTRVLRASFNNIISLENCPQIP